MSDTARLEFVKITVADLDAATAFYATALQQIQTARFELGEGEDALEEVIMGPQGGAGQNVVLVQYKTPRVADAGSTVLGFGVTGIKTVLQRVKRAGGSVVTPPKLVAAGRITAAVVQDPEGHRIELVERHEIAHHV